MTDKTLFFTPANSGKISNNTQQRRGDNLRINVLKKKLYHYHHQQHDLSLAQTTTTSQSGTPTTSLNHCKSFASCSDKSKSDPGSMINNFSTAKNHQSIRRKLFAESSSSTNYDHVGEQSYATSTGGGGDEDGGDDRRRRSPSFTPLHLDPSSSLSSNIEHPLQKPSVNEETPLGYYRSLVDDEILAQIINATNSNSNNCCSLDKEEFLIFLGYTLAMSARMRNLYTKLDDHWCQKNQRCIDLLWHNDHFPSPPMDVDRYCEIAKELQLPNDGNDDDDDHDHDQLEPIQMLVSLLQRNYQKYADHTKFLMFDQICVPTHTVPPTMFHHQYNNTAQSSNITATRTSYYDDTLLVARQSRGHRCPSPATDGPLIGLLLMRTSTGYMAALEPVWYEKDANFVTKNFQHIDHLLSSTTTGGGGGGSSSCCAKDHSHDLFLGHWHDYTDLQLIIWNCLKKHIILLPNEQQQRYRYDPIDLHLVHYRIGGGSGDVSSSYKWWQPMALELLLSVTVTNAFILYQRWAPPVSSSSSPNMAKLNTLVDFVIHLAANMIYDPEQTKAKEIECLYAKLLPEVVAVTVPTETVLQSPPPPPPPSPPTPPTPPQDQMTNLKTPIVLNQVKIDDCWLSALASNARVLSPMDLTNKQQPTTTITHQNAAEFFTPLSPPAQPPKAKKRQLERTQMNIKRTRRTKVKVTTPTNSNHQIVWVRQPEYCTYCSDRIRNQYGQTVQLALRRISYAYCGQCPGKKRLCKACFLLHHPGNENYRFPPPSWCYKLPSGDWN